MVQSTRMQEYKVLRRCKKAQEYKDTKGYERVQKGTFVLLHPCTFMPLWSYTLVPKWSINTGVLVKFGSFVLWTLKR